jgi:hypothetical protein
VSCRHAMFGMARGDIAEKVFNELILLNGR